MIKLVLIYLLVVWTLIIVQLMNALTDIELWGEEID